VSGSGDNDRRTFLKRAGLTALVGAGFGAGALLTYDPKNPIKPRTIKGKKLPVYQVPVVAGTPRVAIARGTDAKANLHAALKALGGLEQFIKRGDRVVLKPNAAFDRTPEQGANCSPEVVGEVTRLCFKAGARTVTMAENTLFDPERCLQSSGIGAAVRQAGGRIHLPKKDSQYAEALIDGMVLDTWPVMKIFWQADKVINLPTAKHHRLARVSLGLKNWMGAIGGQRRKWHQKLSLTLADMAAALQPTLTVLDASRVLMRHGPTGGQLSDVKRGDTLIVGWDQVAVDNLALPLLDAALTEVPHLSQAARRGVGKLRLDASELVELKTGA
jgi:uncharacterized protein (DUF362 family)